MPAFDTPHTEADDKATDDADPLAGATILVVDDEESNRRLLEMMIGGRGGAVVHTLADPRDTVEECRRLSPNLLMLDLHMPEMDGVEVIAAVREEYRDSEFLPIIVLTADVTPEAKERALAAGANDFLSKPFDHMEVLLRAGNLLETGANFAAVQIRNRSIQSKLERHDFDEATSERLLTQRDDRVKHAFESGALRMVFQPIADLANEKVVGFEALARFDIAPQRSPALWFAEAADTGRGVKLELHAISAALSQLSEIADDQFLMLNASATTASSPGLMELLADISCEQIVLTVTKLVDFDTEPQLQEAIDKLRSLGVRIAVGDSGLGNSGLRGLIRLQPELIRLDEDLSNGVDTDPTRRALVRAILGFAAETGSTVIADGIDQAADLETLRDLGVPCGQGYRVGPPGPSPRSVKPHGG